MNRSALTPLLLDLGWLALIHRALGGKPAESFALHYMLKRPGRQVSAGELSAAYAAHWRSGGSMCSTHGRLTGTRQSLAKVIERLRASLGDLGIEAAITTIYGESAYRLEPSAASKIEQAIIGAAGGCEDQGLAA